MRIGIFTTIALLCALGTASVAHAQADSTDVRPLQFYAFGGPTGNFTGLAGGRNIGVTAGLDLGFGVFHGFLPTVEVRGTEPFDDGNVDSQKDVLGGLRIEKRYGPVHPYVDAMFGRGEITYSGSGYLDPAGTTEYQKTNSNLIAFGVGADIELTPVFSLKIDGQFVRYKVPVTTSGELYSKPITVGVVYRFGFGQRHPQ